MEDNVSKIGHCGFTNIGNTCYMNSVLQLIFHNEHILSFILSKKNPFQEGGTMKSEYDNYLLQGGMLRLAEKKRRDEKLSNDYEITINRTEIDRFIETSIIRELSKIANIIIYKGNSEITPQHIKKIFDYKIPVLRGFSQQDSHELLINMLDIITDETGIESEPEINNIPQIIRDFISFMQTSNKKIKSTDNIEEKRQILEEINKFKRQHGELYYKYEGLNYMVKIFRNRYNPLIFKMKTFIFVKRTCNNCGDQSCIFENTPVISLDIIDSDINNCFNFMIRPEEVDYKCQICENTTATRITKIWRPGMFLFVHLKRFKMMPNGRIMKIDIPIDVPFELDLNRYCDESMKTDTSISYKYTLKGFINHYGGYNGGHYTADCISIADRETWFNYNDSSISKYNGNQINTSNAYILMYELIV